MRQHTGASRNTVRSVRNLVKKGASGSLETVTSRVLKIRATSTGRCVTQFATRPHHTGGKTRLRRPCRTPCDLVAAIKALEALGQGPHYDFPQSGPAVLVRKTSRWTEPADAANTERTHLVFAFEKHMIAELAKAPEMATLHSRFLPPRRGRALGQEPTPRLGKPRASPVVG